MPAGLCAEGVGLSTLLEKINRVKKPLQNTVAFALAILLTAVPSHAGSWLKTNPDADTAYLPYRVTTIRQVDYHGKRLRQLNPIQVYREACGTLENGIVMNAYNPQLGVDESAVFDALAYPYESTLDDDQIGLIVVDYRFYHDSRRNRRLIAGPAYGRDSLWLILKDIEEDTIPAQKVFLDSGTDGTGDGCWRPEPKILLVEDYDFDGLTEIFCYNNTLAEGTEKALFCVELETLRLEWSVPVAPLLNSHHFFANMDSANPAVVFTSYNPKNGASDTLFSDLYQYLTVINSKGHITFNRIIGEKHGGTNIVPAWNHRGWLITHELPITGESERDGSSPGSYYLSLLDENFQTLLIATVRGKPSCLWTETWGEESSEAAYVITDDATLQVFDRKLELLEETAAPRTELFFGRVRVKGHNDSCLVFSNGLFTRRLEPLLVFPIGCRFFQPLAYDSSGNMTSFVINNVNRGAICRIQSKSHLALASIFLHRNQTGLLMLVSALVVGLVMVNYYRHRARANLRLISKQKTELQETHEALKNAQAQLVAQEKFRQAKDIAGGFAHEIRNALLPAETALFKFQNLADGNSERAVKFRSMIDRAVSRALDLTREVSRYTSLENEAETSAVDVEEVMDDVIETRRERLTSANIGVEKKAIGRVLALCDEARLRLVIGNLVDNAADALTDREDGRIFIEAGVDSGQVIVSVSDNGCGINEGDNPRVFDTFYSTKPASGHGLGLAIVKKIVELYDGSIEVDSKEGQGSRFTFRLKAVDASASQA